jgi:hypothetical protein
MVMSFQFPEITENLFTDEGILVYRELCSTKNIRWLVTALKSTLNGEGEHMGPIRGLRDEQ